MAKTLHRKELALSESSNGAKVAAKSVEKKGDIDTNLRLGKFHDLERTFVQAYADAQKAEGKPPVLRFVLHTAKPLTGALVEIGTYVYVLVVKVEDEPTRIVLPNNAVDHVLLGVRKANGGIVWHAELT